MKIYRLVIMFFIIILTANSANAQTNLFFKLLSNESDQKFKATIILKNFNLSKQSKYELAFNSIRPIKSVDHGVLIQPKQGGDFYTIQFNPENDRETIFNIKGQGEIKKYSEVPNGYFIIEHKMDDQGNKLHSRIIKIYSESELPAYHPGKNDDEDYKNNEKENTSIEGNPVYLPSMTNFPMIVPFPVDIQINSGYFEMNQKTRIFYQSDLAKSAAYFLKNTIKPATGYSLSVNAYSENMSMTNTIFFEKNDHIFSHLANQNEAYAIRVNKDHVIITASSESGFFYGVQTLRQLLPPQIFSHHIQSKIAWNVPQVIIFDYPRFAYRGMHLDVARHFIPSDQVKRLIDLMAMHKLNYFQWHLSDDEGFRIEIKRYPSLTAIGAWRGYSLDRSLDHDLLPAFGSGDKPYGGYYTQKEIKEIVQYAKDRHITIIPEIDMPGHARALIMSLPKELIDESDHSQYTSIQGYHDNVLSPCKSETFDVIDHIFTEIADLFPGQYIHIGGDEVPENAFSESCMTKQYDRNDPAFKEKIQNDFLKKIQKIIQSKGKIMAGWEEIAGKHSTLDAPLRIYIWNSNKIDQTYKQSEKAGYEVIMSPAENLYFDLAYNADPKEPGQYWAGYVDTFSAYSLQPIDSSKGHQDTVIKGVQGQLWSEVVSSRDQLDYFIFPKLSGLSELGWTKANLRNWKNFSDRMKKIHIKRLDYYGVKYRNIEFK